MEFSENVPANTQASALVISDRMLKFKSDGSKDERLILDGTGDRDGAHRGSIGEDKGKSFICNCSIRRQC